MFAVLTETLLCLGYADPAYPFSTQPSESAASQINQLAFAANSAATSQYLSAQAPSNSVLHVLSSHPGSGSYGTKVSLRVTSQYDLSAAMTAGTPFVSVLFGSQRCAADVSKGVQDSDGSCTYTIVVEAPQFLSTTCPSLSNVPLTVLVENAAGAEIARASNAGTFSYHDAQGGAGAGVGAACAGDTSPPDLGSPTGRPRSPVRSSPPHQDLTVSASATTSIPTTSGLAAVHSTTTYGFPPSLSAAAAVQAQVQAQSDYVADATAAYSQGSTNMLSTYRGGSYTDHYARPPPILRSPAGAPWASFNNLDSLRSPTSAVGSHGSLIRPGFPTSQHSTSHAPPLVRTSTLTQQAVSNSGGGSGHRGYGLYQTKATLKILGDLQSMAENWTHEEWDNRRRLVVFKKQQTGSVLSITFRPVSAAERPPNSICISCIWWRERGECYVTSVDTIHLLEQLLAAPSRFSVEEKNRIRRNLEGFHPLTVSKAKAESEEFFKVIMSFGNPKPRNIEKDVKVFSWKTLGQALSKIISKYSAASTTTTAAPGNPSHMMTPVSMGGSYSSLPPAGLPPSSSAAGDPAAAAAYISAIHHHSDAVASPTSRRLSSGGPWSPYNSAIARAASPVVKTSSPMSTSGLRISTVPAVYDSRGLAHSLTSPYVPSATSSVSHHGQGGYGQTSASSGQSQSRSWASYSVADGYPPHSAHSGYSGTAYERA